MLLFTKFKRTRTLFLTTAGILGATYAAVAWKWYKTRADLADKELAQFKKGYKENKEHAQNSEEESSLEIQNLLNTGDIVLYKHKCIHSLYPQEVFHWYLTTRKEDYSGIGFVLKTQKGTHIINPQYGKVNISPFKDFLAQPYIGKIKARNLENPPVDISKKTVEFVSKLQRIQKLWKIQGTRERHSDAISESIQEGTQGVQYEMIVQLYYHHLGVIKKNPYYLIFKVKDFDLETPEIFYKSYKFTKEINIRPSTPTQEAANPERVIH